MSQTVTNQLEMIEIDEYQQPSQSLMEQFEQLIVSSLFKAFGLNAQFFKDQDGGNVDTLVRARQYGIKDEDRKKSYDQRGEYNSRHYHGAGAYREKNAELGKQRDEGTLIDAYTGEKLTRRFDLDHIISAKEIHNDPARVLADLNGSDLANRDTNLNATNFSINRSKNADKMDKTIAKFQVQSAQREEKLNELKRVQNPTDTQKREMEKYENLLNADFDKMKNADIVARKAYNQELAKNYYTSQKFLGSASMDAFKSGGKMGIREVLGFIFTEVWISVRKGIKKLITKMKEHFNIKDFFLEVADIFKMTFANVLSKYKQIITTLRDGILSGILSSITTTIVNIFVGTAKRIIQVIRECWASIVEISKILFFSKEHKTFGQKMKAISKILVGLVTVLLGTLIHEAISKIPGIGQLPVIGEALSIFLSSLITGIISIGLLYFIDHAKEVKEFFTFSYWVKDNIRETTNDYRALNVKLGEKAAELAQIPYEEIQKLITKVSSYNEKIEGAQTNEELQVVLKGIVQNEEINMGYSTNQELLGKLRKKTTFVFE